MAAASPWFKRLLQTGVTLIVIAVAAMLADIGNSSFASGLMVGGLVIALIGAVGGLADWWLRRRRSPV